MDFFIIIAWERKAHAVRPTVGVRGGKFVTLYVDFWMKTVLRRAVF